MPWNPLKSKALIGLTATAQDAIDKHGKDMEISEPKPQFPGIHCPVCGGDLAHKITQDAYGCPCELVKINAIELVDKDQDYHKGFLKAKMEIAAAYAVDMAFEKLTPWQAAEKQKGFTYTSLDGKETTLPTGHPYLAGYPPTVTKQEPLKADRNTIKLENLSPALQEFFKDYIKPDKVES